MDSLKDQIPGLTKLREEWSETYPVEGLKILVNCHLTDITLRLIDVLLAGGAKVYMTVAPSLTFKEGAFKNLPANVTFLRFDDVHEYQFDIICDCGGLLLHLRPVYGAVELTHVPMEKYKSIEYPVITVDKTSVKVIETFYGTSDGFIRTFEHLIGPITSEYVFSMIGYGNVGKGIVHRLRKKGATEIEIFDPIKTEGEVIYDLNATEGRDILLRPTGKKTRVIITATGVVGCLSQFFSSSDFGEDVIMINMGTFDEYGPNFPIDRVLNGKRPYNFALEYPTLPFYIDPIFVALLKSIKRLPYPFCNHKNGLQQLPSNKCDEILASWLEVNRGRIDA